MKRREDALAYITNGDRLLVFWEPDFPDAPVQPPGGGLRSGETPQEAVLREAREETGLEDLRLGAFLGDFEHEHAELGMMQHFHCFHVICDGNPPDRWRHLEKDPGDGSGEPIVFELYWVPLKDSLATLVDNDGAILPRLAMLPRLMEMVSPTG